MKKLLLILFLIHSACMAQQIDSSLIETQKALNHISLNLNRCHEEYKSGVMLWLFGAAAITGGALWSSDIASRGGSGREYSGPTMLYIMGGILQTGGIIMVMDSHKFIGRASSWRFQGNKFVVDF